MKQLYHWDHFAPCFCRVGLLPTIQRPLEYVTSRKAIGPSKGLSHLQPVLNKVRSVKQSNKQSDSSAKHHSPAKVGSRPKPLRELKQSKTATSEPKAQASGATYRQHCDVANIAPQISCKQHPSVREQAAQRKAAAGMACHVQDMMVPKPNSIEPGDNASDPKVNSSCRRSGRNKVRKTD